MRIAILVHSFPPKWMGGTEIASYNLAKRLGELGHEVHIFMHRAKSWNEIRKF